MPPIKKKNPIAEKLLQLVESGKSIAVKGKVKVSKELICALCDLKYPTLENVFYRPEISYATLKGLKFAGFVTDEEEVEYKNWLAGVRPRKKRKKESDEEARNSADQYQEQVEGDEDDDGAEVFDTSGDDESDSVLHEE